MTKDRDHHSLLKNLGEYFKETENGFEKLHYIKSGVLILVGASLSTGIKFLVDSKIGYGIFTILAAGILFYAFMNIEKLFRNKDKKFPIKILDHLVSEVELEKKSKDLKRKETIDKYIDNSIKALNLNTCNIYYEDDYHLCHQGLKEGISSVISDLIFKANYVLDSNLSKYSIILYFENIAIKTEKYQLGSSVRYQNHFFLLRDDVGIETEIPDDIHNSSGKTGLKHILQTQMSYSFNHNTLSRICVDINEIGHTLITSPVQAICETDIPSGLFIILADDQFELKNDIENILQIYGRIVSNWIDKYNNCVHSNFNKLKNDELGITKLINDVECEKIQCCPVQPEFLTINNNNNRPKETNEDQAVHNNGYDDSLAIAKTIT